MLVPRGRFGRTITVYLLTPRVKQMNVTRGSDGNSTAVRPCPAVGTDMIWCIDLDRWLVATRGSAKRSLVRDGAGCLELFRSEGCTRHRTNIIFSTEVL